MAKILEENTNIVILGTWNLGILTPEWFKEQFPEIVKEKEIPIEVALGVNSFRFVVNSIQINPSTNKLVLNPKKLDRKYFKISADLAVGIIDKLPHTPIFAVGNNISFLLENEKFKLFNDSRIQEHHEFYKSILKSSELDAWQMKDSLSFENYILNITYDYSKQKKIINFNYHYPIVNKGKIKDYLAEFPNNITKAEEILKELMEK